MPDITMCENHACPSAKKCYRHEAKPDPARQSYTSYAVPKGRVKCEYYMPVWKGKRDA